MMTNDNSTGRRPRILWAAAIVIATIFLTGVAAGFLDAMRDAGRPVMPTAAGIGLVLLGGAAALFFYTRRFAGAWGNDLGGLSPRQRRYWLALGLAAVIGGVIGAWMTLDQPQGHGALAMVSNGPLSAGFAIGASFCWTVGLAVSMILYHRAIDDHEQRAWLWASTAGWYAIIFPAPVWWVLHRAELAPPADVMLLFLLSMVVNAIVYLWLKFR
jgi:hypothetical protein